MFTMAQTIKKVAVVTKLKKNSLSKCIKTCIDVFNR